VAGVCRGSRLKIVLVGVDAEDGDGLKSSDADGISGKLKKAKYM